MYTRVMQAARSAAWDSWMGMNVAMFTVTDYRKDGSLFNGRCRDVAMMANNVGMIRSHASHHVYMQHLGLCQIRLGSMVAE